MTRQAIISTILATAGAIMAAACSPGEKKAEPAPTATVDTAATAVPAVPALLQGIPGVDRIPPSLLAQIESDTASHWARCGDDLVARVVGADGKDQGFIVARSPSFQFVDTPIDVPSQQRGVTARQGINLRSNTHVQYFGEGVSRTDISGRTLTKAGWGEERRLTAPLPFWRADQVNGAWVAEFRPGATDAGEWSQRHQAADCAAVPQRPAAG